MKNKTTTAKNSAPEPYFAITTDEEARSADIDVLEDNDLKAFLRCIDRCLVATRAGTDYDKV